MQGRLAGNIRHVFSRDPAIDRTDEAKVAKALKHTRETGEPNGLPVKEGRKVALWHICGLSEPAYAELSLVRAKTGGTDDQIAYVEARVAVSHGLVKVEDADGLDGRPLTLAFGEGETKVLKAESLRAIYDRFGPKAIHELGQRIVDISNLDPQ